jgi:hypothetical protein
MVPPRHSRSFPQIGGRTEYDNVNSMSTNPPKPFSLNVFRRHTRELLRQPAAMVNRALPIRLPPNSTVPSAGNHSAEEL